MGRTPLWVQVTILTARLRIPAEDRQPYKQPASPLPKTFNVHLVISALDLGQTDFSECIVKKFFFPFKLKHYIYFSGELFRWFSKMNLIFILSHAQSIVLPMEPLIAPGMLTFKCPFFLFLHLANLICHLCPHCAALKVQAMCHAFRRK